MINQNGKKKKRIVVSFSNNKLGEMYPYVFNYTTDKSYNILVQKFLLKPTIEPDLDTYSEYIFESTYLPNGLILNENNGQISGYAEDVSSTLIDIKIKGERELSFSVRIILKSTDRHNNINRTNLY